MCDDSCQHALFAHKFTGDEHDSATNLEHTWFRQYSSSIGRWMTPDPAGLAAVDPANPQSWNRYAYVTNDPIDYLDPFGLCGGGPGVVTVSIGGVQQGPGTLFTSPSCSGGGGDTGGGLPLIYRGGQPVGGGGGGNSSGSSIVGKVAKVLVCAEAFPLTLNSWLHGGGSGSIGFSGNATLGAPTGGADFGASFMFNADSWGDVSVTTTTAYNPMGQGILIPSAGASWGGTIAASGGTTSQITGPSFGGWAAYGPLSVQGAKSANGGPVSGGVTYGQGIGFQAAAANLSNTTERRRTNCLGAAITLTQWAFDLFGN